MDVPKVQKGWIGYAGWVAPKIFIFQNFLWLKIISFEVNNVEIFAL